MNKKIILAAVAIIVTIALSIGGFVYWQEKSLVDGKIIRGVKIADVEVGNLSAGDALKLLAEKENSLLSNTVKVQYGEKYWTLPYTAMSSTNLQSLVNNAVNLGRGKGPWQNYKEIKAAEDGSFNFQIKLIPNETKVKESVYKIKLGLDTKPIEPKLTVNNDNTVNIKPPNNGVGLDMNATSKLVLQSIKPNVSSTVKAVIYPIKPHFTAEDVKRWKVNGFVTTFTTAFNPLNKERTQNVKIAANAIDKYVVYPGEEFSFNKVVGPRSKEAGYEEALVIQNNIFTPGLGGGICQVSSTLYNNILKANLNVIERKRHSLPVGYVSPGLDSTVAFGLIDLKFKNQYDFPIVIRTSVNANKLFIGLLGNPDKVPKVNVTTDIEKVLMPSGSRTVYDPNLPKGKTVIDEPKKGYKVTVYKRIIATTGAQTLVVSKDTYPPTPQIIRVGTNTKTVTGEAYGQDR